MAKLAEKSFAERVRKRAELPVPALSLSLQSSIEFIKTRSQLSQKRIDRFLEPNEAVAAHLAASPQELRAGVGLRPVPFGQRWPSLFPTR